MGRKQSLIYVMNQSLRQRVESEKSKVKVPIEYQMKYLQKAKPEANSNDIAEASDEGSSACSQGKIEASAVHEDVKALCKHEQRAAQKEQALQDQIRISYLEASLEKMEGFYGA